MGAQSTTGGGGPWDRLPLLSPGPGPSGRWRKSLRPPPNSDNSHGDKMAARRPAVVPQATRTLAAVPAPPHNASAPLRIRPRAASAVKKTTIINKTP